LKTKQLKRENLTSFFKAIRETGKIIIAPRRVADKIYFSRVDSWDQVDTDYIQSPLSVKGVLFPRWETLLRYSADGKIIRVLDAEIPDTRIVIFGLRPCDVAALNYVTEFFLEGVADTYIQKRRSQITLITLSCKKADSACFCTSVGLGPAHVQGSDLVMTEIEGGHFYVEIFTPRGEELITSTGDLCQDCALTDKTPYLAVVPLKFDQALLKGKLLQNYDHPLWLKQSLPCLGCGACAFVCPTCTCFDIQDEGNAEGGERLRRWDSCGFSLFTLHASGHNPRPVQSYRWRQRIMHKFVYTKSDNGSSCVGCGRCVRVCPAQVSIIEHMQNFNEVK
jgi:sulfhydrogenase subunit beta (sulfur reductase)